MNKLEDDINYFKDYFELINLLMLENKFVEFMLFDKFGPKKPFKK